MDIPDFLNPTWPVGFDAWEGMSTLFAMAALKAVRGTVMKRRASSVDRFGWSIILWDFGFAIAAALNIIWTFYPSLLVSIWLSRVNTGMVLALTLWQMGEVILSRPERVEAAVSGVTNGNHHYPTDTTYDGPERRTGPPDRRREGLEARGLI